MEDSFVFFYVRQGFLECIDWTGYRNFNNGVVLMLHSRPWSCVLLLKFVCKHSRQAYWYFVGTSASHCSYCLLIAEKDIPPPNQCLLKGLWCHDQVTLLDLPHVCFGNCHVKLWIHFKRKWSCIFDKDLLFLSINISSRGTLNFSHIYNILNTWTSPLLEISPPFCYGLSSN